MAKINPEPHQLPTDPADPFRGNRVLLFLGAYFLAHMVIRLIVSDTLALDEAEQVLVSQWFQWGYSGQPPLYAWIQRGAFEVLGTNLLALALVKNGLLSLAYGLFWLTARRLWPGRSDLAVLAVLSWLLIPQIVWEAQRDLSHSVMVLTLASATLYAVARALTRPEPAHEHPGLAWYLAYGLLMGLGMLSKYNFVVFAGALNLALLSLPEGRRLLLNPRILLSLTMAGVVFFPHFYWTAQHWEVATRSLGKVEASAGTNRLEGLGVLVLAGISFLTPLWIVLLGFFPGLFGRARTQGGSALHRLVRRYLWVLALGTTLGVLVLGVGHVKERWMIPFLFLAPLYAFSGAEAAPLAGKRVTWFRRIAVGAALATLLAAALRVPLGPRLGVETRVNYPFDQVAEALETLNVGEVTLLAHNAWFAGNLKKRMPEARAYVPGFVLPDPDPTLPVLFVWDALRSGGLPEEMREDLSTRFGLDPGGEVAAYLTFPYKFGAGQEGRVGYVLLPAPRERR